MTEQAVKIVEVVTEADTAQGEQAHARMMFVGGDGAPVTVGVPDAPAEAGTYVLQAVVDAEGSPSFSWVTQA